MKIGQDEIQLVSVAKEPFFFFFYIYSNVFQRIPKRLKQTMARTKEVCTKLVAKVFFFFIQEGSCHRHTWCPVRCNHHCYNIRDSNSHNDHSYSIAILFIIIINNVIPLLKSVANIVSTNTQQRRCVTLRRAVCCPGHLPPTPTHLHSQSTSSLWEKKSEV